MKTLGIIANCTKKRARSVLARLQGKAAQTGIKLFADPETASIMDAVPALDAGKMFGMVDAIMALGGDGTMLRLARELNGRDVPVIGVNIGSLGFLTSVAEFDLERALDCLAADDVVFSSQAIAEIKLLRGGVEVAEYRALNDIVVSRGSLSRVVTLDVDVDNNRVTSYVCDGLIIATPAGSTGHSLSAGGPILAPDTRAFVVNMICPHSLSSRPLVVNDGSTIIVKAAISLGELFLSVDGQVGQPMEQGDIVRVSRSRHGVRFIHLPGHSYFSVLRQKLRWSGSNTLNDNEK